MSEVVTTEDVSEGDELLDGSNFREVRHIDDDGGRVQFYDRNMDGHSRRSAGVVRATAVRRGCYR